MPDNHYEHPRLAEIYDLNSSWSPDRDFYLSLAGYSAGSPPRKILDIGCGTGLICRAYAEKGRDVTGLDPSPAMLEVGKQKPHGKKINWVCAFAQSYHSDELFDLIIMTGHAFQALLSDEDVLETFSMIRDHLKPDGSLVFESRNPDIDWAKVWDYDVVLDLEGQEIQMTNRLLSREGEQITHQLTYQFPDETLVSTSTLRFMAKTRIETHLAASGLKVDKFMGDWNGGTFDATTSREMIFVASVVRK